VVVVARFGRSGLSPTISAMSVVFQEKIL